MAKPIYTDLDFNSNQLIDVVFEKVATDPASPSEGRPWFNTTDKQFKVYNGTSVVVIPETAITRASAAGAAGELVVSAGADRTSKTYDGSAGMVKVSASGVASAATDGTDYVSPSGAATLDNKTIDVDNNTLSNVEVDNLKASALASDIATGTSSQLATADVIKAYVDGQVTALGQFVGDQDASAGLPTTGSGAAGAIVKGDYWRISVAGTISGLGDLEVGDVLTAKTDDASVAADFFVMQGNITDAVTSAATSVTDNAIARMDGTTGKIIQGSGATISDTGVMNVPSGGEYQINGVNILDGVISKYTEDFIAGDWSGTGPYTYTVSAATHGLTSNDELMVQVRDDSGNIVEVDIAIDASGNITITSSTNFAGSIVAIG